MMMMCRGTTTTYQTSTPPTAQVTQSQRRRSRGSSKSSSRHEIIIILLSTFYELWEKECECEEEEVVGVGFFEGGDGDGRRRRRHHSFLSITIYLPRSSGTQHKISTPDTTTTKRAPCVCLSINLLDLCVCYGMDFFLFVRRRVMEIMPISEDFRPAPTPSTTYERRLQEEEEV